MCASSSDSIARLNTYQKNANPETVIDSRPICFFTTPFKVIDKIIRFHIKDQIDNYNTICDCHSALGSRFGNITELSTITTYSISLNEEVTKQLHYWNIL